MTVSSKPKIVGGNAISETTWATKPTASECGVGQAWFSDLGVMGYSDGVNWNLTQSTVSTVTTGAREGDVAIAVVAIAPFEVIKPTTLNRVSGTVGTTQAAKLMEIGIYNELTNVKIVTTEKREVPEVGGFEFSHPPVTLQPGRYYYALTCNGTTATFGHAYKSGGFLAAAQMPLLNSLTSVVPASYYPALTGYSSFISTHSGFAEAPLPINVKVYGKNGTDVWGYNSSSNKMCISTDSGATFTDMMSPPTLGAAGFHDLQFNGTKIIALLSNTKIWMSSDLTAGATWSEISCPISAGLKRSVATTRPYAIAIFQDYLVWGEYTTGTIGTYAAPGPTDLQSDPSDPAGPRIFKYGPLSGTPAWSLTKQLTYARHVHSLFTDGANVKLWVSVGDTGYQSGANNDYGIWRCTAIATDTWVKWTNGYTPNNAYYPIDFVELNPAKGAATGLYGTSDATGLEFPNLPVGKSILFSKVSGTAGQFNLNASAFVRNGSTETTRSMVVDTATAGTYNMFVFAAESPDPWLYVSPAPYVETYPLVSISDMPFLGRSIIVGGYLICVNKRWALPKFSWQR